MTREEIIARLKNFEMGWEKSKSATAEFWRAVIDELEQEPSRRKGKGELYEGEFGEMESEDV